MNLGRADRLISLWLQENTLSPEDVSAFASKVKTDHNLSKFQLHMSHQGHIELADIEVPKGSRKQGTGSAVMQKLTRFADQHGKRVWLQTADRSSDTGTTSKARLQKFYAKHGFVRNRGRNKDFTLSMYASMYRNPKA
jgi:GNAT superfamily N-acetyltransferase